MLSTPSNCSSFGSGVVNGRGEAPEQSASASAAAAAAAAASSSSSSRRRRRMLHQQISVVSSAGGGGGGGNGSKFAQERVLYLTFFCLTATFLVCHGPRVALNVLELRMNERRRECTERYQVKFREPPW